MNPSPTFGSFVSPRSRARITKILLIVGAVVSAASMIAGALELAFPTFNPEDEIEANPGALAVGLLLLGLAVLQILIYIPTVVFYLMWLYRSYENLPHLGTPARNISYSSGWAVGSFFVPFVSLVVPYRAIKELWRNSTAMDAFLISESPPVWFPLWWTFWLLATFASRIYFRISLREDISREVIAIGGVLTDALTIIAAVFAIAVIEEITRRQEEASVTRGMSHPPSQPPPPPTFGSNPLGSTYP